MPDYARVVTKNIRRIGGIMEDRVVLRQKSKYDAIEWV